MIQAVENSGQKQRWYVVANKAAAVFYSEGKGHAFHPVERHYNKKALISENGGGEGVTTQNSGVEISNVSGGIFQHALDRKISAQEQLAKRFAHRIAKSLDHARHRHRFEELILVAEPYFLSLLRETIAKPVRNLVRYELPKEYAPEESDLELRKLILGNLH